MIVSGGDGLVVGNARALGQGLEGLVQECEAVIDAQRIAGAIEAQRRRDFEIPCDGPFILNIKSGLVIANMSGQQRSEPLRIVTSGARNDGPARKFIESVEGIPATNCQALQSRVGHAVEAIVYAGLQRVLPEIIR